MTSPYSRKKVQKEILKAAIEHPTSLILLGVSFLTLLYSYLFDGGNFLNMFAGVGFVGSVLSIFTHFKFRNEILVNEYFVELERKFREQNERLIENIKSNLNSKKFLPEVNDYLYQGNNQFDRIQDKFKTFEEILDKKFNRKEITYRRFQGVAEEVYSSILDNLDEVVTILKSSNAIDLKYIKEKLSYYKQKKNVNQDDLDEIETLKERWKIKTNQMDKINKLLSLNEQAMTKLDATTNSLAGVKTKQGKSKRQIEQTIEELERLADNAKNYELH